MNSSAFIRVLEKYVNRKKQLAHILYRDDELTIKYVEDILDQKLNHTKRVVAYVTNLTQIINMHVNYEKIAQVCGLFHDIGRFNQGLKFRSYNDSETFLRGQNHGDYGYELITTSPEEVGIFDQLVDRKSRHAVATTVKLHQRGTLPVEFNQHLSDTIRQTDPETVLSGSYEFNDLEKMVVSALLQMVRDADRIDILWQRATGDIVAVKDQVFLKNTGNVPDMAKRWGVSKEIILANNDQERLTSKSHIIIPRRDIPVEKLFVSSKLLERIKRLKNIDLRSLQQEDDYTFITALWWSIYTFLKDMNFVGNLKQVKERELLEQIYNQYPIEYRPLLDEIFKFAREVLIEEQLASSQDDLYVNHLIKKIDM